MRRSLVLVCSLIALAASVGECVAASESLLPFRRDSEFLRSGKLMGMQWVNPAAADTDAVSPGVMLDSSAAGTHTFTADEIAALHGSGTTNQGARGLARAVSVNIWSASGTAADVAAGTVTITGTNILDATITEAFTITDNTENSQQGTKAFKTIVSYAYTAMDDDSICVSIGVGAKLGLWNTLASAYLIKAFNGTTADGSATITADDDEIEKNVIDYNTDPNGTTDHSVLYWIPPWAAATAATKY